jgi:hypothetical protein
VLIADLGLAKAAAHGSGFTLTVGTPGYMAPEQARPGEVTLDRRADVFAVGAVLHHLLTGVAPKQDEPSPPVRSLRPEVPAAVEAVVTQALATRPEDRFPSAAALADALDAAALRTSSEAAGERLLREPPVAPDHIGEDTLVLARPTRHRRRLLAALVVLLVLAGAGTAAVLVRDRMDVTVSTADGAITLRIPPSWAKQVRRSPWDLGPYGVTGRSGIALAAAPDVASWADPDSDVPGVFAGRADGVQPRDVLARSVAAGCPEAAPRSLTGSGLSGTLTRKVCAGSTMAYVEAVLQPPGLAFSVYVQVKERASSDTADQVIRSLVVNWS